MTRWIAALTVTLLACNAPDDTCGPGASRACVCANGESGAQLCASVGDRYGECLCVRGLDAPWSARDGGAEADSGDPPVDSPDAGRLSEPMLTVSPELVSFGKTETGTFVKKTLTLSNTGGGALTIDHVVFAGDAQFEVNVGGETGHAEGGDTLPFPVSLSAGESLELLVIFRPVSAGDATATLEILGRQVILRGLGVLALNPPPDHPVAVIAIDEGTEVIPQTVLHLKGDQSTAPPGAVATWAWSVEQPVGSQSVFVPEASFPNPTFEANVAGTYLFRLVVANESGKKSAPQELSVVVIPNEVIHVELLWDTPKDPDQTGEGPEAGADMDLHFLHPYASGPDLDGDGAPDGWFDQPFDCFWFNPNPNWGSFDPAVDDDPGLDRDDTDGAGPENMNLNIPESGKTYRVGVHYWHDHKYGPSVVTLRVYIYATLVWERRARLHNHDMWEAATIHWPSGEVKTVIGESGSLKITPNYENPFFFQP